MKGVGLCLMCCKLPPFGMWRCVTWYKVRAFRRNIPSLSAGYFCTRKVTATGSFDTLVKLYHITRRRIPGDSRHCFENLLSYNLGDYLKRCIAQTVYRVCTRIHYRVVSVTKLNKYLHCGTSGTE